MLASELGPELPVAISEKAARTVRLQFLPRIQAAVWVDHRVLELEQVLADPAIAAPGTGSLALVGGRRNQLDPPAGERLRVGRVFGAELGQGDLRIIGVHEAIEVPQQFGGPDDGLRN